MSDGNANGLSRGRRSACDPASALIPSPGRRRSRPRAVRPGRAEPQLLGLLERDRMRTRSAPRRSSSGAAPPRRRLVAVRRRGRAPPGSRLRPPSSAGPGAGRRRIARRPCATDSATGVTSTSGGLGAEAEQLVAAVAALERGRDRRRTPRSSARRAAAPRARPARRRSARDRTRTCPRAPSRSRGRSPCRSNDASVHVPLLVAVSDLSDRRSAVKPRRRCLDRRHDDERALPEHGAVVAPAPWRRVPARRTTCRRRESAGSVAPRTSTTSAARAPFAPATRTGSSARSRQTWTL